MDARFFRTAQGLMMALVVVAALTPSAEARGTRVKSGEANRVFVMSGFKSDCSFAGHPDLQLDTRPSKGQVSFKQGDAAHIQYSLSGNCVGQSVEGTGIYYTPVAGQTGTDTFTVTGRIGSNEPATRTFHVIIDENGNVQ
jgi:hypothetical protein